MKFFATLKRFWVIIMIAVLAIGGFVWYKVGASNKSTTTYQTGAVTKGTLTVSVSGTGNVVVSKQASVNPGITGEVTGLSVAVGDTVKAGQFLFKLENDDLDISVNKAYVTYLQAQQSLENAKSQLTQAQINRDKLIDPSEDDPNDNIAPSSDAERQVADQAVAAAQLSVKASEVNVDSAKADYELQKETAAKRTVTAPIDGTITTLNINNGDQYGSSSTSAAGSSSSSSSSLSSSSSSSSSSSAAMVIDDLSSLKVSIDVNEVDSSSVKAGQKVSMTFDAIDGLTLTGKVEQISTVGTNSSGVVTYPATISFDSVDSRVKQEMSVTATITTDVKQDVLMVANSAVKAASSTDDSKYVLLMKDGTPTKQTVTVGSSNDSYTEITEGLSEGDVVVTQTLTASSTATTSSSSSRGSSVSGLGSLTGGGMGGVPGR